MRTSRLRVLHVGKHYPPFMGGIETHLRTLAEGLLGTVEIEVVVAHSKRVTVIEQIGPILVKRLKKHFSFHGAPVCLGFAEAIRESDADIVHLHLPNPAAAIALLWSGYKGPLVVTYHSDVVRQRFLAWSFEPILRSLLRRCNLIIATSEEYVVSSPTLRAFASKCRVIPYGIDVEPFAHPSPLKVAAVRSRFGKRIVLAVGRLIYYKGFGVLIAAMKDVDGHLIIIGDGPLRDSFQQQVAELGIADRVTFLGEIQNEETTSYYRAANVFALPSVARSEAFGIVQIEAMAAGTPVINTRLDSGVPSVSLDGITGLTVAPRDARALSSALRQLLDDPDEARAFGEAGQLRAAEKFSVSRMCEDTLRLYSGLTPGRRGSMGRIGSGSAGVGSSSRNSLQQAKGRHVI